MGHPSTAIVPVRGSFFDLPPEIRIKIYEFLFCLPETIRLTSIEGSDFKQVSDGAEAKVPVHAFELNKKFLSEASAVLYSCKMFCLNWARLPRTGLGAQPICKNIVALAVHGCQVWAFAQAIQDLAREMPLLRTVELEIPDPWQFVACVFQLSCAIIPCAAMFEGPELHFHASVLSKAAFVDRSSENPFVQSVINSTTPRSRLQDIRPKDDFHVSPLTRYHNPRLALIRIVGTIPQFLLGKIEQHACLPGDCKWIKTGEENKPEELVCVQAPRRVYYQWKTTTHAARSEREEVDMRQWYPELPQSYLNLLRDLMATPLAGTEPSVGGQATAESHPHGTETIEHANGDNNVQAPGEEVPTFTPSTSCLPAITTSDPANNLYVLGALPFPDYVDVSDDETSDDSTDGGHGDPDAA